MLLWVGFFLDGFSYCGVCALEHGLSGCGPLCVVCVCMQCMCVHVRGVCVRGVCVVGVYMVCGSVCRVCV